MFEKRYTAILPIVAIMAFMAVAAASASAAPPEYKNCVRQTGGNYEKGCTTKSEPGKGKYEREAVAPGTTYTSKSKASTITIKNAVDEVVQTIVCKKDSAAGTITSSQYGEETLTFTRCAGSGGKKTDLCGNVASGTIQTETLGTELVYLPGEKEIGVRLAHFGGPIATFTCGTEPIVLEGSVIGHVENTNKGEEITFGVVAGQQEQRFLEESGVKYGPYNLYTQEEEGREATLETVERQTGPGAY
jgi:hypothetical protein